jgi:hypothetical protein
LGSAERSEWRSRTRLGHREDDEDENGEEEAASFAPLTEAEDRKQRGAAAEREEQQEAQQLSSVIRSNGRVPFDIVSSKTTDSRCLVRLN